MGCFNVVWASRLPSTASLFIIFILISNLLKIHVLFRLTGSTVVGAFDPSTELLVSSLLSLAFGFAKDLKILDFSRFKGTGLLVGFLSGALVSTLGVSVLGFGVLVWPPGGG